MKRIVFINQDSGYLMIDIITEYVNKGYDCILFTGRLVERNRKLPQSVKIEKIIRYRRTSKLYRLFTWSIGFIQILTKLLIKYPSDELFIVSNPPLAPLLPLFLQNQFSLLIFDIYPDVLVELGYSAPTSAIVLLWQKLNRKIYPKASEVYTISEGMGQVLKKYRSEASLKVNYIWTDNTFFTHVSRENNHFIKAHNLSGKFVVMYSGNLGLAGDVEVMISVAGMICRDDIVFIIIGEGAKKKLISSKIEALGPEKKNVILLPWQPVGQLPYTFSAASLAVISLGAGASKLAIPSKIFNFMSVGAPLLCISEAGSEIERLVEKYNCGKNFEPSDIEGIAWFIQKMADDNVLMEKMSMNSLLASRDFSVKNAGNFLPDGNIAFNY
ncbi:MAG TPA: glycosyltransferase family 4 protein [Paludibacter sp.]|nr:glycosyltransferase family 4 protein [Paludibacter sp.]